MSKTSYEKINNISENASLETLKDFFKQHSLEESRNTLWKWLNVSGCGAFDKLDVKEREDLLTFYAHLQGLLETVHKIKVTLDTDDILR
jgi:uncharacterized cysteine cluster protein YcgN (CxxCxxCC family)